MSRDKLRDILDHLEKAAAAACRYTEHYSKEDFLADERTQQAVIMNLVIMGEASKNIMDHFPDFAQSHAGIEWFKMRGMRNRIAHGYFDINIDLVWETVKVSLPELRRKLQHLRSDLQRD